MNNLSNERLKEIVEYQPGGENYATRSEWQAMSSELLAYREAQGKAVVIVEESDYLTVAQMTGKEPRRKAVRELYEGALIVGSKLYAAPQLPAVPDVLPCPVKLEPGLTLGKGVKTQTLLDALIRREKYYAELEAMTPEQRTEHEEGIASIKSMLATANHAEANSPVIPDGCDNTTQQFESLSK